MADSTSKHGCGVFSAVFGRRTRRSVSTSSLPNVDVPQVLKTTSKQKSDSRRRNGSDGGFSDYSSTTEEPQRSGDRIISRPSPNHKRKVTPPVYVQPQQQEVKKTAPNAKVGSAGPKIGQNGQQHFQSYNRNKRVPQGSTGISGELEAMIDEQRSAYAGNMKVYGNLGNLRQGNSNNINNKPKTEQKERSLPNGMGNITRKPSKESHTPTKPNSYCRALSTRMDPEQLKIMGNEDYKNGRFAEALSLYDAAIFLDPEKASYRSNKSAALTSLGRLLEAVFEAREAIRIEPSYERAHNRLATLYLRLGDPDQTTRHYKQAGSEADPDLIIKAKKLQVNLKRCNEARKLKDWNRLLKETMLAISAGADSALQIYTLKAEALIKLHRHHEADQVLSSAPKFEEEDCTKFYGPVCHANLLVVQAQVDLAAGRIDEALEASQMAGKIDSDNKEANTMLLRIKAVMDSRSKGNEHFRAAKYSEACVAYGEGLYNDSFNSVLLCNRAACRSKLGQFEKAIDDCDMALNIRPSYSKARLRRADCYAKLGKWQASIDDYEVLTREAPENEEVSKALREAKEKLKRQ
ncbi:inactive TPR repeat-containing thioredoxin TTL3-like protein [Tanacetum coccineum]